MITLGDLEGCFQSTQFYDSTTSTKITLFPLGYLEASRGDFEKLCESRYTHYQKMNRIALFVLGLFLTWYMCKKL